MKTNMQQEKQQIKPTSYIWTLERAYNELQMPEPLHFFIFLKRGIKMNVTELHFKPDIIIFLMASWCYKTTSHMNLFLSVTDTIISSCITNFFFFLLFQQIQRMHPECR